MKLNKFGKLNICRKDCQCKIAYMLVNKLLSCRTGIIQAIIDKKKLTCIFIYLHYSTDYKNPITEQEYQARLIIYNIISASDL